MSKWEIKLFAGKKKKKRGKRGKKKRPSGAVLGPAGEPPALGQEQGASDMGHHKSLGSALSLPCAQHRAQWLCHHQHLPYTVAEASTGFSPLEQAKSTARDEMAAAQRVCHPWPFDLLPHVQPRFLQLSCQERVCCPSGLISEGLAVLKQMTLK